MAVPFLPKYSISSSVRPAFRRPPMMAMVAGTAPFSRMMLLDLQGGLHVLGIGHAVGDDGGLQSDDGLTGGNGLGDFGVYVQITC